MKKKAIETNKFKKASIIKRLIAYGIDIIIYGIFSSIFIFSANVFAITGQNQKRMFMMLSLVIISIILFSYLPKRFDGQTIGKKILQIRIEKNDGKKMTYWTYFLREFVAKISMGMLLIPMTILYSLFIVISRRKLPEKFMLDQLFSVDIIDLNK